MERRNIHKNIYQLFNGKYHFIVPLYQRNFAWTETEITLLLQDLYENFNSHTPYFVGSIIVLNRCEEGKFEVIDGQQRLTVLTLLINVLGKDLLPELFTSNLEYDSRDDVMKYLNELFAGKKPADGSNDLSEVQKTFNTAHNTIETAQLNPQIESLTISYLKENAPDELRLFAEYISSRVFFVLAEMPADTDVATYFETMNNTGEQLRKHEIVKSLLLDSAKDRLTIPELESLALVWDACSQMEIRIQEAIPQQKRTLLFGNNLDAFLPYNITKLSDSPHCENDGDDAMFENIINNHTYKKIEKNASEIDDNIENRGSAIIDFPNFLMHVLRLYKIQFLDKEKDQDIEIPLNEKDLLSVFRKFRNKIDPVQFMQCLLFYRILFDRYIVRTTERDSESRWELKYLIKASGSSVYLHNTFGKGFDDGDNYANDKVIKALSMLQVSNPQRKYKTFLFKILSWFKYGETQYDFNWFMPKLNGFILSQTLKLEKEYGDKLFYLGTRTPRFVLNLIDYLYYLEGDHSDFNFKYYNSVEHHLPQSWVYSKNVDRRIIDSIGNLFLISRRANSSLNAGDPLTKARKSPQIINSFPPNRKKIYLETIDKSDWNETLIKKHEAQIRNLISRKQELLKVSQFEEGPLLYRACFAVSDYCTEAVGNSKYGFKYDLFDLSSEEAKTASDKIASWLNDHLDKSIEDFIDEQLQLNTNLSQTSWRKCFVKYPSIIDFCNEGKFTWSDNGFLIYLLPQNQVVNNARELHCHLFFEKSDFSDKNVSVDQNGVWISMNNTILTAKYPDARMYLHIWVDHNKKEWRYEIWSGRKGNAAENKFLKKNGWIKNENGQFILRDRLHLCDCPQDYETATELAITSCHEIMDKFNH